MEHLSLIPVLFLVQLAFLFAIAKRGGGPIWPVLIPVGLLLAWALLSAYCAITGVYDSAWFLAAWPGLWAPVIPFFLVLPTLAIAPVRRCLIEGAAATPAHWFVAIQALRVAAIGTLIKTIQGEFPLHVELAIGITDLAFGISAVALYSFVKSGKLSSDALIVWHRVGILIIALPAGFAIQASLPGALSEFGGLPASSLMFDYPMALAPTLVVPIFLILSNLAIIRESKLRATAAPATA